MDEPPVNSGVNTIQDAGSGVRQPLVNNGVNAIKDPGSGVGHPTNDSDSAAQFPCPSIHICGLASS